MSFNDAAESLTALMSDAINEIVEIRGEILDETTPSPHRLLIPSVQRDGAIDTALCLYRQVLYVGYVPNQRKGEVRDLAEQLSKEWVALFDLLSSACSDEKIIDKLRNAQAAAQRSLMSVLRMESSETLLSKRKTYTAFSDALTAVGRLVRDNGLKRKERVVNVINDYSHGKTVVHKQTVHGNQIVGDNAQMTNVSPAVKRRWVVRVLLGVLGLLLAGMIVLKIVYKDEKRTISLEAGLVGDRNASGNIKMAISNDDVKVERGTP